MEDEVGKYKKKKKSNASKSHKKSKHKHTYEKCLVKVKEGTGYLSSIYCASYCTICGKIVDIIFKDVMYEVNNRYFLFRTDRKTMDKYKNYPLFEIEDLWQEYVPIGEVL